ncbi:4-dihydrotrisporin dehydrogenase [Dichotomocladium elegans]|nr:4-dihydrotrisporin dehydrogenase [Dichotomocladium elegans]
MSLTYVITGASRGLGLEFVKQLSSKGHTVIACARKPENSSGLTSLVDNKSVYAVTLNTIDIDSVKAAAEKITQIAPNGIDVLINNSGISGPTATDIYNTTGDAYAEVFNTNVIGTSNMMQELVPLLKKGKTRHIINISSIMGSNANTTRGTGPAYRVSKAAENMLTRAWAGELGDEGFVVIAMHPGWVQTDMGGSDAPLKPEQSVSGMLSVLDKLVSSQNGAFLDFKGDTVPW